MRLDRSWSSEERSELDSPRWIHWQGGAPSADLSYVLPEAKSAVSLALPLDLDEIRAEPSKLG
jgi:epoxyqueuosine reductase QueG